MKHRAVRSPRRYETTLDRAGLALGAGSVLVGAISCVLLAIGGQAGLASFALGMLIGSVFGGIAITAVAGPLWLVMHVAGLRSGGYAALVGAVTALALFLGAQTYGSGQFDLPDSGARVWLYRGLSALATSAVLAGVAALIGLAMWRIAYRRQP